MNPPFRYFLTALGLVPQLHYLQPAVDSEATPRNPPDSSHPPAPAKWPFTPRHSSPPQPLMNHSDELWLPWAEREPTWPPPTWSPRKAGR